MCTLADKLKKGFLEVFLPSKFIIVLKEYFIYSYFNVNAQISLKGKISVGINVL